MDALRRLSRCVAGSYNVARALSAPCEELSTCAMSSLEECVMDEDRGRRSDAVHPGNLQ